MLIPLVSFDRISQTQANFCLGEWAHKMGPCERPFPVQCFALRHEGYTRAVIMHGPPVAPQIATEVMGQELQRERTVEVVRLCAWKPGLCRVVLRLWREFVFPSLQKEGGIKWAISYQDAELHTGNTYRFDGWERIHYSSSGTDARSGRAGRKKWIWLWPPRETLPQYDSPGDNQPS